eukprot:scaffold243393_cov31-Tisochrysis_lutea.AAC.1
MRDHPRPPPAPATKPGATRTAPPLRPPHMRGARSPRCGLPSARGLAHARPAGCAGGGGRPSNRRGHSRPPPPPCTPRARSLVRTLPPREGQAAARRAASLARRASEASEERQERERDC